MRAVFDTNVVVSSLVFGRRLGWLRHAWAYPVASPAILKQRLEQSH